MASERTVGYSNVCIRDVKPVLLDVIQTVVGVHPGVGSPSRLRLIALKVFQGPNCEGRLLPVASSVKPNTRPEPLKIWTCILLILPELKAR